MDGYKRHVLRDLDCRLIVAVGVTPANAPEAHVTDAIETDLAAQQCTLRELHIDRAYLASQLVQQRADTLAIFCKAWPVRQGPHFAKSAFHMDWARHELRCPGGEVMPFAPGRSCTFRRPRVGAVRCGNAARRAHPGAVSVFIPMKPCCRSCVNASRPRRDGRSCASAWPSNMPWRTLAIGKAVAPATGGCGRMCLICGDVRSCIICMC